jgi:hypothetical protein
VSDFGIIAVDADWGWVLLPDPVQIGALHVLPVSDIAGHMFAPQCPCVPFLDENTQVRHNSFDGREAYEMGTRKPH